MSVQPVVWPEMVPRSDYRTLEMERDRLKERLEQMTKQPPRWLRSGMQRSPDECASDSVRRWWTFPPTWTLAQIKAELWRWDFDVEPRHCRHEYDCCGNWYTDGLYVEKRTPAVVLVTCSWYRNI